MTRTLVAVAITQIILSSAAAAAPQGKTFSTPEKAVEAAVAALRNYNLPALVAIFGEGSERIFQSDDEVWDRNRRQEFLRLYDEKQTLASGIDDSRVLVVGEAAWPFPVPLVKSSKGWAFDTAAGIDEIMNRRIGQNELDTIQTCLAIADAQRDYFSIDRDDDGVLEYAQLFHSTVGRHDGLFWPVESGNSPSPLGLFAAMATDEGYRPPLSAYHGYVYRLLKQQGPSAPGGGEYPYLAGDDQIGGFAILAYPAAYGDTGIMTFALNHTGVVYQKDLGPETDSEAKKITVFEPGDGWTKVSDQDLAAN